MSTAIVFGLLFLFSGHTAIVQSDEGRQIKSCPVLTDTEATTVLGPGTIFVSGVEATSGKVRISLLCEFLQDERTLEVTGDEDAGRQGGLGNDPQDVKRDNRTGAGGLRVFSRR